MSLIASKGPYTKGLRDLGNGCYAWLQPRRLVGMEQRGFGGR
jgi:hypothetical protein